MTYEITYTKETLTGPETVKEIVPGGFIDAHYRAHSLTNCSYVVKEIKEHKEGAPRSGHQVTKATRQYVALAPLAFTGRKTEYEVFCVGNPGESRQDVLERASFRYRRFLVTLSVARRSYKKAWAAWEAAQDQADVQELDTPCVVCPKCNRTVFRSDMNLACPHMPGQPDWYENQKAWEQQAKAPQL